jgi:hypothetical protein
MENPGQFRVEINTEALESMDDFTLKRLQVECLKWLIESEAFRARSRRRTPS